MGSRSTKRGLGALLLVAGAAAASACAAVLNLDDIYYLPDAGVAQPDGSLGGDGSTADDANADAGSDASACGVSFCACVDAAFCADFDLVDGSPWGFDEEVGQDAAAAAISLADSGTSAPNALRLTVSSASDPGPVRYVQRAVSGALSNVDVSFRMRVHRDSRASGAFLYALKLYGFTPPGDYIDPVELWFNNQQEMKVSIGASTQILSTPPLDAWVSVHVSALKNAQDGGAFAAATIGDASVTLPWIVDPASAQVLLRMGPQSPTRGSVDMQVDIDDVVVRFR